MFRSIFYHSLVNCQKYWSQRTFHYQKTLSKNNVITKLADPKSGTSQTVTDVWECSSLESFVWAFRHDLIFWFHESFFHQSSLKLISYLNSTAYDYSCYKFLANLQNSWFLKYKQIPCLWRRNFYNSGRIIIIEITNNNKDINKSNHSKNDNIRIIIKKNSATYT